MELLLLVFVWPALILVFGLLFIAFFDVVGSGDFSPFWLFIFLTVMLAVYSKWRSSASYKATLEEGSLAQLDSARRFMVAVSIAGLLPIFTRYLVYVLDKSLIAIIIALVMGFAFTGWGMLMKGKRLFSYSNVVGGALVLIYAYTQLWALGEGARIIAAAFGLVMAVIVSVIKLKDKLT